MTKYSVSKINKALECPRAYRFRYVDKIERNRIDTGVTNWGKLFHSAMAAALRTWYYLDKTGQKVDPVVISAAIDKVCNAAVNEFWNTVLKTNLTSEQVADMGIKVETMAEEVANVAYRTFTDMNMGIDFKLASFSDISDSTIRFNSDFVDIKDYTAFIKNGGTVLEDYPLVEYNFEYEMGNNDIFVGYMDCVLIDLHTNEFVLCDFKTMDSLPDPEMAQYDEVIKSQLAVYQWVLRKAGLPIAVTMIYQVMRKVPRKPRLVKNQNPKLGSGKQRLELKMDMSSDYPTYLGAIYEYGLDPDDYTEILDNMRSKHYMQRVYVRRNDDTLNRVMADMEASIQYIKLLHKKEAFVPQNNWVCKRCTFHDLCHHIILGGTMEDMLEEDGLYRRKE